MDTVIYGAGQYSNIEEQVDPTWQALRASIRPLDIGGQNGTVLGGHYSVASETGSIAAGGSAAAPLFQVWWASANKNFILKKLKVQCNTLTAFTTLGGAPLELIVGHNATAAGSGGTALTMNSSNRLRSTFANTDLARFGEVRIATTTGLSQPTGTALETNALAAVSGPNWLQGTSPEEYLYDNRDFGEHPLTLQDGDVLMVRTGIAVGATGVYVVSITMSWAESVAY